MDGNISEYLKSIEDEIQEILSFLKFNNDLSNAHTNDFFLLNHDHILERLVTSYTSLDDFVNKCAALGRIGCCYSLSEEHSRFCFYHKNNFLGRLTPTDQKHSMLCASEKKQHEITRFLPSIIEMTELLDCNKIVDFGSGKGYLSHCLSSDNLVQVIGIEGNSRCAESAGKREKQLERFSTHKAKGTFKTLHYKLDNCVMENAEELISRLNLQFSETLEAKNNKSILIGLHACGDLTSMALRLFVKESFFKGLHIVGCCYNLISDGFPLSDYLKKESNFLNKNAKMLACQCPAKWMKTDQALDKSLLYRAILEKLSVDCGYSRDDMSKVKFRRMGRKSSSFKEYVSNLNERLLTANIFLSESMVDCYATRFESQLDVFKKFHWETAP